MTTEISPSFMSLNRKFSISVLLLFWGIAVAYGQGNAALLKDAKNQGEWWFPLLQKHNIDPAQFSFGSNLKPASDNPKGFTALELGNIASSVDSTLTIKNPLFIIKEEGEYSIVNAKSATQSLSLRQITFDEGKLETYKFDADNVKPERSITFAKLQINTRTSRAVIKEVNGKVGPFKSSPKNTK